MNQTKSTEDQLRDEVQELKRQLNEQKSGAHPASGPSAGTLLIIGCLLIVLIVAGFFLGYLPRHRREEVLAAESKGTLQSLPAVNVARVTRSDKESELVLPGNIQAVTEAPLLARASGYIKKRYVDMGDRVKAGQVLAEIEAPELDQQILQARATLDQTNSSVQQAEAAVQQGLSNENLAKVTAGRWENLQKRGVVSKQENDTYQAQWVSQQANVQALEKAVAAARSNVGAAQANLDRLIQLKSYQTVRAPFAGVITVRNVDTGAGERCQHAAVPHRADRVPADLCEPAADRRGFGAGGASRLPDRARTSRSQVQGHGGPHVECPGPGHPHAAH